MSKDTKKEERRKTAVELYTKLLGVRGHHQKIALVEKTLDLYTEQVRREENKAVRKFVSGMAKNLATMFPDSPLAQFKSGYNKAVGDFLKYLDNKEHPQHD